ncbi:MAG: NAD(P)-binding domain-containing protein, partial [Bacteroidales bacterium]|nr:NAD(P)-binding domain-containing protein [Bacteroidales bacterium]
PMDLPLVGKVKLFETSKSELLDLWQTALRKNTITVNENSRVESVIPEGDIIKVTTIRGEVYSASSVLLAIGRRGTPRKLNIPGEDKEKVAYRLLEPEGLSGQNIVVVGGGDSAVESALLLADQNRVTLSYRNEAFNRIKPKNNTAINEAVKSGKLQVLLKSNLVSIEDEYVDIMTAGGGVPAKMKNDLVYIFAGGELPTQFLEKAGIIISRKFGETVLKH